jgi:hypothetical protein
LQTDPEICAVPKEPAETERGVSRNGASFMDDIRDPSDRHSNGLRQDFDCQATRFNFVAKRTAGMDGEHDTHPLMIIDNLNIIRVTVAETKAYAPWPADCDGPLASSRTFERMQTDAFEGGDLIEPGNRIELCQAA